MIKEATRIKLAGAWGSVEPSGIYQYSDVFDSGVIEELRVQAKIAAYGTTKLDVMSTWIPLSGVPALARADSDDWDAWVEIRTSDSISTMSTWVPLSTAKPLKPTGISWQPWRRVESADVTGRLFQFRLIVVSRNPDVNVNVTDGLIEIDVLERVTSYPDVVVPAAGAVVHFNPPYREPPALAVTIDGNSFNVRYEITHKDAASASVKLMDTTTNKPVAGKVDVSAIGWGRRRLSPI
jgi:hypothetical protein